MSNKPYTCDTCHYGIFTSDWRCPDGHCHALPPTVTAVRIPRLGYPDDVIIKTNTRPLVLRDDERCIHFKTSYKIGVLA